MDGKGRQKAQLYLCPRCRKGYRLTGKYPGRLWRGVASSNSPDPYTGEEWVHHLAVALGVTPEYRAIGKGMLRFMGLFSPMMRELAEMAYQTDRDYVFDSSKFEKHFKFKPTSYTQGIQEVVAADFGK